MWRHYLSFVRMIAAERLGRWGVVLTTSAFCTFVLAQLAMLVGLISNAYVGLIIYMVLPGLFMLGLVLIPIAWWRRLAATGLGTAELLRLQHADEEVAGELTGAPVFRTVLLLTLINVLFLGGASLRMLHFMDSPHFCGTACHQVMSPEWTTYQRSPHARVACVECHVGEGVGALMDSKLNGSWQVISATFDLYERPIPTPVHQLRPARQTCERCHWPDKFYGSRLQTILSYGDDEASSPSYTTLNLKIDAGNGGGSGVHWHVGEANAVRYASVGDERRQMRWVEARQPDGGTRRYTNIRLSGRETETETETETEGEGEGEAARVMDCVDCHNRATHIYQEPGRAVDERLRRGDIARELPFIRREAVAAITAGYPSAAAAREGIRAHLLGFYRRHYRQQAVGWLDRIDAAAQVLVEVYEHNVHHEMRIGWGAYPSLLGHTDTPGCFRCHSRDLQDAEGRWISDDCTLCHSILAYDEADPFQYLQEPQEKERNRPMHEYLRREFLSSF